MNLSMKILAVLLAAISNKLNGDPFQLPESIKAVKVKVSAINGV